MKKWRWEYSKMQYACCSSKLIINNECLVYIYIHSLDFLLIFILKKIVHCHISKLWTATGPNLSFMVLASSNLFEQGSLTTCTTTKKRSMNYAFVCLYPTLIDLDIFGFHDILSRTPMSKKEMILLYISYFDVPFKI